MRRASVTCLLVVTALVAALGAALPASASAQVNLDSLIPHTAPNCRVTTPPASAGLAVSPGGFLMVFPRNDALTNRYTGCKLIWVVDTDRTPRLATLYFELGALTRAVAHDVRDPTGGVEGACAFPEGRSLVPTSGRRFADSACRGFAGELLYALRVPTYPRSCLAKPDAPVCQADPR